MTTPSQSNIEKAKEIVTDYEARVGQKGHLSVAWLQSHIASALQSVQDTHEREVAELREAMVKAKIPHEGVGNPKCRPCEAATNVLSAFDARRKEQAGENKV